ncbi:NAD(P)/FAD-dependent oxidoreductase [Mesorhizobium sp.]|uniref:FAD-dependent oxidoreductase n=1 Tax=Mesorhizobium sp. TaxID=1871066 RepID=UPI0025D8FB88|nr:NAD(P)/FAD-dependent oxidoreductase [Mesorhizobium sp.]
MMKARTAEIAGAGLAGLVMAAALAQKGWRVVLHERSPELRMFGAGIWVWESGLKVLEMLGAFEQATRRARIIQEWRVADETGDVLASIEFDSGARLYLPLREDLYDALIARCVDLRVELRTSSEAVAMRPDGTLVMASGEERKADLVVAADGVNSKLRDSVGATRLRDYGLEVGIRLLIDQRPSDPTDVVTEYWNGPLRLLYNPCSDTKNYIFLGAPLEDERANTLPIDRDYWAEKFPVAADYVARFEVDGRWDRIGAVRCSSWSNGRTAIIGDAAHGLPPNLGQQAMTAFVNAMAMVALLEESNNPDDIPNVLARWERQQKPLANHVQEWSYIYGIVVAHWPASLMSLRGDALRFLSSTKWLREGITRGGFAVPPGYRK